MLVLMRTQTHIKLLYTDIDDDEPAMCDPEANSFSAAMLYYISTYALLYSSTAHVLQYWKSVITKLAAFFHSFLII